MDIINNVITNFKSNMDKSTQAVAKSIKDTAKISGQFSTSKSFSIPKGLEDRWDVLAKAAKEANIPLMNVEKAFNKINMTVLKNGQIMSLSTGKIVNTSKAMGKLTASTKRFNMSLLSIMFGMASINRALTGFLRSAITTYQKANEDTEGLGKATWELQAGWEFLKYSLIDALTQSGLFRTVVEWLIEIVKWFNKLDPKTKELLITITAIAAGVTGFIAALSSIGLLMNGLDIFISKVGVARGALSLLSAAAAIGIGIVIVWKGFQMIEEGLVEGEIIKQLKGIIVSGLGGAIVGAALGSFIPGLGTALGAVGGFLIGISLGVVFKIFKAGDVEIEKQYNNLKVVREKLMSLGEPIPIDLTGKLVSYETVLGLNETTAATDYLYNARLSLKDINESLDASQVALTDGTRIYTDENINLLSGVKDLSKFTAVYTGNVDKNILSVMGDTDVTKYLATEVLPDYNDIIDTNVTKLLNERTETDKLTKSNINLADSIEKVKRAKGISIAKSAAETLTQPSKTLATVLSKNRLFKTPFGSKAIGGAISQTGPYMLHEGEFVVPRGSPGNKYYQGNTNNNSYNINLTINADTTDPDQLSRIILDNITYELNKKIDSVNN